MHLAVQNPLKKDSRNNIKAQVFLNMFTWSQIFRFTEICTAFLHKFYNEASYVRMWILEYFLEMYSNKTCLWHMLYYTPLCHFFGKVFLITVPIKKRNTENIKIPSMPVRSSKGTNCVSHHSVSLP